MTPEGYEIVRGVLDSHPETRDVSIIPKPHPGEDIRDVIISGRSLTRESVVKVLKMSGLMRLSPQPHLNPDAPVFGWAGGTPQPSTKENVYELIDIRA
jgi:hypothetical protein